MHYPIPTARASQAPRGVLWRWWGWWRLQTDCVSGLGNVSAAHIYREDGHA